MIDLAIDSRVFITSKLDEAVQELDMIFNTTNGELIGYSSFGTNFEQFLWHLNPETESIKEYINEKINDTLFLKNYRTDINVNLLKGEYRMIYNLVIHVYDSNNRAVTRKYQFR
jgi:hypothetical protein